MRYQSRRARFTRCRLIHGYFPVLERIDVLLEEENPEIEREKVNRAIVLLFGERPDITDFRDAFPATSDSTVDPTTPQSAFNTPHS